MLSSEAKAKIGRLITDATEQENAGKRTDLLNRYLGEPYGDEVEGRSQFVDTAAQDAVEALLPDVMDVFTSAPEIVEFAPIGREDEEAAKMETAAVSHVFWQENRGFLTLYTWLKESMIQQNAYVWRGWQEIERTDIEEWEGLTFDEYQAVMLDYQDKEYEVEEQSGLEVLSSEATGEEMVVPTSEIDPEADEGISLRIRCTEVVKEYKIEPFPQEDFFGTPRWNSLDLEGIPCCGRIHRNKTESDWLAFGFSPKSVELLKSGNDDENEKAARHHTQDLDESEDAQDYLELYEVYINLDVSGNGSTQLMRIWCTEDGSTVMDWKDGTQAAEEVPCIPFSALTPYIMPHRHVGQSVVEKVDDLARVKTVLWRQTLDAIYGSLYKRPHYNEEDAGDELEEDLANPAHGAPVRTGGAEVTYPQTGAESVPMATIPLMEKLDGLQEIRTGSTRYNQGLDADSLNKTMGGMSMILNASQKKAKLIARTFAETGLVDLFKGIHRDLRAGPMREIAFKRKGQWVYADPRKWRRRNNVVPNVGMGKGDRDERRAGLSMIGQVQEKLIAAGSRMVDESKLYATFDDTLDTFGMDGVDRYFYDPQRLPPPPPPPDPGPDPILMSAQAQMAKVQADAQAAQNKHELEMQKLRLEEIRLTNSIQNERETLDLREKEVVMKDDLERDKLNVSGASSVPYGQVTSDTQ